MNPALTDALQLPDDPRLADEGWRRLHPSGHSTYDAQLPPVLVRCGDIGHAEARIETGSRSANVAGGLHGGFLTSFAEVTLFLPLFLHGRVSGTGVATIDFTAQFLAAGNIDEPVFADVELLRETGRMAFVRGILRQQQQIVAYTGTLRKFAA